MTKPVQQGLVRLDLFRGDCRTPATKSALFELASGKTGISFGNSTE